MWKVIRRGVIANKVRFLLTAIAVILGVAFISGTFVLTSTISKSFDDLFGNINKGTDAVVRERVVLSADRFGGGNQRPNMPASLVDFIRKVPGVEDAQGNVNFNTSYAQAVDKHGVAIGGSGPPTFGLGWDPNPKINQFHIVAGRKPINDDEIVLDKHTAGLGPFHVGDKVEILTVHPPRFYRLVGIAKFGTADSLLGASITLFTMPEAQRLNNSVDQYGQISVVADPGISQTQVQQNIEKALAEAGKGNLEVLTGKQITKENQDQVHKALNFFNIALSVFGFLALIVGAFIIYNTFSIVVAQRAREMALLRALGASRRQVMGQITGESFIVGVLASATGVVAGIFVAIGLRALLNALGFSLPSTTVVVPASAVILGLIVGTAITMVSAIVPARQAARIPPIAALREFSLEQPVRRGRRLSIGLAMVLLGLLLLFLGLFTSVSNAIQYVGGGAALIFAGTFVLGPLFARFIARAFGRPVTALRGITGELAKENAARNPRRTTTTAIPLTIGVALVGFITIFAASASATITHAVDSQFNTDFIVSGGGGFGGGGNGGFSPALAASVAKSPITALSTGVRFNFAGVNGKSVGLLATDPASSTQLLNLGTVRGSFEDLKLDGIAVSKKKADDNHWELGQEIPVTFVKTGTISMPIQYIYKQNTFGDYIISIATYDRNYTQLLDQLVLIKMQPGVTAARGRAVYEPLVKPYPTAKLKDNAQFKNDQIAQFNQLVRIIDLLLFFSVFIALIGIANTLILSIHERTHEIGLLRAVGMGRRQVRSSIRWESVIICLIGTTIGLAIGLLFGWSFVRALKDQGFSQFAIAPGSLLFVVVLLALLAVVAAILPARRASKLDILRAIAAE
jgi:putative ABC transport system permease protein